MADATINNARQALEAAARIARRVADMQEDDSVHDMAWRNSAICVETSILALSAQIAPPADVAGLVKPLEWVDAKSICTREKAPALGGHYSVVEFDEGTEKAHYSTNIDLGGLAFVFILEPDPKWPGKHRPAQFPTLEAAKAAAQADYEARILGALTIQTAAQVQAEAVAGAVAQMREALQKLGRIPGPVWIALDEVTTDEAADVLARRDAETREKALREAADLADTTFSGSGTDAAHIIHMSILALIKEPAHD